jgi:hypothetical protein
VDSVTVPKDSDAGVHKAQAVLLAYLQAANYPPWPGADGLTVDDVLRTYPQASAEGLVPGLADLRNRHPEFAEYLEHLFPPNPVAENSEQ